MNKRLSLLAALAAVALATPLHAGIEGRLSGEVQDPDGKPIVGARVTLMAQEVDLSRSTETNKRGKFTLIVADASKEYLVRVEAAGYEPIQEAIKLPLGSMIRKTWTLKPGGGELGSSLVDVASTDPAAKAYNDGARAYNLGSYDEALVKFQEATSLDPELKEAVSGLMMIHWGQKNHAEAGAAAERLVALDPENTFAHRVRYDSYLELGDERAAEALDELVAIDRTEGTAKRVFNTGVAAVRANDADAAIERFQLALEIDPSLAAAWRVLGQIYNQLGRSEEAVEAGRKLLELEPDSVDAHNILYQAHRALGDDAAAEGSLAVLQSAQPEQLGEALFGEGKAHFESNRLEECIEVLEQLLEVQPDHPDGHYTLGLCYLNKDNKERAVELLERFLELKPDHPEAAAAKEMLSHLG